MSTLLTHATITVSGTGEMDACREQINRLLLEDQAVFEERHGDAGLRYDLRVADGIPFPAFVAASAAHPALTFEAEWVDPGTGVSGSARIEAGKVEAYRSERSGTPVETAGHGTRVRMDGGLLALALVIDDPGDTVTGYAVTAERDAGFRASRDSTGRAELLVTDGDEPLWRGRWTLAPGTAAPVSEILDRGLAIEPILYERLGALAEGFADTWLWFENAPREEILIEEARCLDRGWPVAAANLRSRQVARLEPVPGEPGALACDTLPAGLGWVWDLVLRGWAKG